MGGFSRRQKLAWAGCALGGATLTGMLGSLLTIFYHDYLGLSPARIATASWAYGLWNAVNDPVFGWVSDSTRSPTGRRIPYIRWAAAPLAASFAAVWLASPALGEAGVFWWLLATLLLFDTAYTMVSLSDSALLPEIAESEEDRGALQVVASWATLGGILLGFLLPELLRPRGAEGLWPLRAAAALAAAVSAALIAWMTFEFKERPELSRLEQPLKPWDAFARTLESRAFLALAAQNFCAVFVQALLSGMVFYLADYVLGMSAVWPMLCLLLPLAAGVRLADALRRRLGLAQAQQVFLLGGGLGLCLTPWLPGPWLLAGLALGGLGLAGPLTLTNILFGQVADQDELVTGRRREGAFFGMNALVTKPARSLALALGPALLTAEGFLPRAASSGRALAEQPEAALAAIRLLAGPIPGAALLLGAVLLWAYPIRGGALARQEALLREAHERKRALWSGS
ncbi:MAG: MFS transporter [Elusimicrobia bacterium]|nr:MFS transporter [Elusimicrobiota bacterium]